MATLVEKSATTGATPHLLRQIGLGSGVGIVVGSMIGSGIFRIPSEIAVRLPGPLPMLAVWVVGGVFALCGALTLAEVSGAFPYSGGIYVFLREGFGRLPAFLFGWAQLLLNPASNGAVAIVFSQYALRLAGLQPGSPGYAQISAVLAVGAILFVTVANVLGVKFGTGIQNLTAAAKAGGLIALVTLAFTLALPHAGGHFVPAAPPGSFTLSMFGLSLISVLFAYDGWMNVCLVGGEVANPRKTLPRAILIGVTLVTTIYITANFAYLAVLPLPEMGKSQIIAADTMSRLVGEWGVTFIVATVMLSTFGALNGGMLTAPRIFFAMAEDRLFFQPLAWVHPRFRTPYIAVLLAGAQSVLYVLTATALRGSKAFSALIDACVVGGIPFTALAVASVFVFRRREKKRAASASMENPPDSLIDPADPGHPESHPHAYSPPVHTLFYPVAPLLFVASTLLLIGNSLVDIRSRIPSLIVLGAVGLGIPLFYATIGRTRRGD